MNCCQCEGIEEVFDRKQANKDLDQLHKEGLSDTTRMLVDAIKAEGVQGSTVLDIGGGVGAIQYGLLDAGATHAVSVDASTAYSEAAKEESQRRGHDERIAYHHGDFVDVAGEVESADIVTLDRVICCYHDFERLVQLSSQHATKLYGLVYPRDNWVSKMVVYTANLFMWLKRSRFRAFIHSTNQVESLIASSGMSRRFYRKTLVWQVALYVRNAE